MTGGSWTDVLDEFEAALPRLEQGENVLLAQPPLAKPTPAERARAEALLALAAATEARMAAEMAELKHELADLGARLTAARGYRHG